MCHENNDVQRQRDNRWQMQTRATDSTLCVPITLTQFYLELIPGRSKHRNMHLLISYHRQTTLFHHVAIYQFIKTTLRNVIIRMTLSTVRRAGYIASMGAKINEYRFFFF
jgi:hypothetical protein